MQLTDNSRQLAQTKQLLENSTFYYIICTDNHGNYTYINSHYAKVFSHINDNFVGKPHHITMHPDDTHVCAEVGGKCYQNPGKLFPATIRKHNGRGGYIITQWEFTLMVDNGEPTGVFCLGYDITEQEVVKSKITTVSQDLEHKKGLLDEIAFNQAHLVRAPLANVIGIVDILKKMEFGVNEAHLIEMLAESSNQLDNVVKSIVLTTNQTKS